MIEENKKENIAEEFKRAKETMREDFIELKEEAEQLTDNIKNYSKKKGYL